MSASLLQKDLKLSEENKLKKNQKKKYQQYKRKRINYNSSELAAKKTKDIVFNNIKNLEQLDTPISLDVSQKIFSRYLKLGVSETVTQIEGEQTVFTEKDFEDFEKEYFIS